MRKWIPEIVIAIGASLLIYGVVLIAQERGAHPLQVWEIATHEFRSDWADGARKVRVYKFQEGRSTPVCVAVLTMTGTHEYVSTSLGQVPCGQ